MSVDISIIIVSFNTCELLRNCLNSIAAHSGDLQYETIVVDNQSRDETIPMLRNSFPEVKLICNTDNTGFARANNQGLAESAGEYVFLLNPDTEIFPDTLHSLKSFMDSHPDAGAAGPRTFLDHEKTLEVCSLKILTPARAVAAFTRLPFPGRQSVLEKVWERDHALFLMKRTVAVEGIGGAAFFTRKRFLVEINGLDEQFFMGYEDTDLAATFQLQHQSIHVVHDSHVLHLFGQAKKLPDAPPRMTYDWQQAPARFLKKYYGITGPGLLRISKAIDSVWRRLSPLEIPGPAHQSHNELTLEWPGNAHIHYLFEISNDLPFFDKFGTEVTGNTLSIPAEICQRLSSGTWYWRIWQLESGTPHALIHHSRFHLSHNQT